MALHTKLVHLDKQIQIHCIYPYQHFDAVQLNTPDYDIEGDTNPANVIQPSNTDAAKDETVTSTTESEDHNTIHNTTHRSQHQSVTTSSDSHTIKPNNIQQQRAEHPSDYHPHLDNIPELETEQENWDEGQFDDTELLYNHNSTEESDRIVVITLPTLKK